MNEVFGKLFPSFKNLDGMSQLKNEIHKTFDNKNVAVIKDREDGYDIHSFLLEYSRAKLFEINYTFKVEGKELKGVWKTQFGESPIENGKIEGNKLSFTISFNDNTINNTGEVINENGAWVGPPG